jgi:hypothetical protein
MTGAWNTLPIEVAWMVTELLDIKALLSLGRTCRQNQELIYTNRRWNLFLFLNYLVDDTGGLRRLLQTTGAVFIGESIAQFLSLVTPKEWATTITLLLPGRGLDNINCAQMFFEAQGYTQGGVYTFNGIQMLLLQKSSRQIQLMTGEESQAFSLCCYNTRQGALLTYNGAAILFPQYISP